MKFHEADRTSKALGKHIGITVVWVERADLHGPVGFVLVGYVVDPQELGVVRHAQDEANAQQAIFAEVLVAQAFDANVEQVCTRADPRCM